MKTTPNMNSIAVIRALPKNALNNKVLFLKRVAMAPRPKKDKPPANSMDQWVKPRQTISSSPYPHAPKEKSMKLHLCLRIYFTHNIMGRKTKTMLNEVF